MGKVKVITILNIQCLIETILDKSVPKVNNLEEVKVSIKNSIIDGMGLADESVKDYSINVDFEIEDIK